MGALGYGYGLWPSHPSWGSWSVRLGLGFGLRPAIPGWGFRGVYGCVRDLPVPRHPLLGCAVWVCVLGLRLRLRPATPGWRVGMSVCLRARSACTRPLLAGVRCGCVCLDSGFGCAPPLLAGVLGSVCVCLFTPPLPRHSWLGCAVWVCVLGLGLRLRPATPGWGVGMCVCVVCTLRLYPATPGLGVRCGCVCFGSGFGCAPPLLAGVLGCVCVCLCVHSACTPPILAGLCGVVVCAWAPVWAAPRHSWLGCWGVCVFVCALRLYPASLWLGCVVWVCVLGLGSRLRPATLGWGVGVCVCSCARSACTTPLLAGVCGVGVCA